MRASDMVVPLLRWTMPGTCAAIARSTPRRDARHCGSAAGCQASQDRCAASLKLLGSARGGQGASAAARVWHGGCCVPANHGVAHGRRICCQTGSGKELEGHTTMHGRGLPVHCFQGEGITAPSSGESAARTMGAACAASPRPGER